jgi:hypothetical protein
LRFAAGFGVGFAAGLEVLDDVRLALTGTAAGAAGFAAGFVGGCGSAVASFSDRAMAAFRLASLSSARTSLRFVLVSFAASFFFFI